MLRSAFSRLATAVVVLSALSACRSANRPPFAVGPPLDETRRATTTGEVVGGAGRYGGWAWLGIPYAAPPVGELRWRAPRPLEPWAQPLEALSYRSPCTQFPSPLGGVETAGPSGVVGDEDCLHLNVFAPTGDAAAPSSPPSPSPTGARRPVMVWIHGGGNSVGSATFYEGSRLATSEDVVVVTVQYRLGPLGWFRHHALRAATTDAEEQSGNFGLLDLIQSLRWVKANAASFGGDPENVTLFGESAGGQNVLALLLAPQAKGLFHRAIVQSGLPANGTAAWAENYSDDDIPGHKHSSNEVLIKLVLTQGQATSRASAKAAIASRTPLQLAEGLRATSAAALLQAYSSPLGRLTGMIEAPLLVRDGTVVPAEPWNERFAKPEGWNRVPVMAGTNRDEAKLFLALDPSMVWRLFGLVPRMRDEGRYLATAAHLSRMWKAVGVDLPLQAMARSGASDLYAYRFDWADEPTLLGSDGAKVFGAAHGLDVPFVFGHFDLGPAGRALFSDDTRASRLALSDAMRRYWATFARTGRPGSSPVSWTPRTATSDGASSMLVLDSTRGRGIRMEEEALSPEQVLAELDADPRLATRAEKCAVRERMVSLGWLTPADAARDGGMGCEGL